MTIALNIVEKGGTFDLSVQSKQEGNDGKFYCGAGWDVADGDKADLDLVAAVCEGGKMKSAADFVYFGNLSAPGIQHSGDNQTGEGDGDDESLVIDTSLLREGADSVVLGLVCYAGADFSTAPNPHFRICDGDNESSDQIAEIPAGTGQAGETALVAAILEKQGDQWQLKNVGDYHSLGTGTAVVEKFGALWQ